MSTSSIAPRSADDARVSAASAPTRDASKRPARNLPHRRKRRLEAAAAQTCGKCALPRRLAAARQAAPPRGQMRSRRGRHGQDPHARDVCARRRGLRHRIRRGRVVLDGSRRTRPNTDATSTSTSAKTASVDASVRDEMPRARQRPRLHRAGRRGATTPGAVNMVRKDNPFPTACAFVCEHPCESSLPPQASSTTPVNIRGIKKHAVDQARANQVPPPLRGDRSAHRGRRRRTVGLDLRVLSRPHGGTRWTSTRRRNPSGGMMRYGIPAYRFPARAASTKTSRPSSPPEPSTRISTRRVDADAMEALSKSHDGLRRHRRRRGEKARYRGGRTRGVASAVDLLGSIGAGDYPDFTGKKVVVIGGGNVAMDCACTSMRAGAEEVSVVYRRRVEDMTALQEIESAIAEGVEMITLEAPARVEADEDGLARPHHAAADDRTRSRRATRPAERAQTRAAHRSRRRAGRSQGRPSSWTPSSSSA